MKPGERRSYEGAYPRANGSNRQAGRGEGATSPSPFSAAFMEIRHEPDGTEVRTRAIGRARDTSPTPSRPLTPCGSRTPGARDGGSRSIGQAIARRPRPRGRRCGRELPPGPTGRGADGRCDPGARASRRRRSGGHVGARRRRSAGARGDRSPRRDRSPREQRRRPQAHAAPRDRGARVGLDPRHEPEGLLPRRPGRARGTWSDGASPA